MKSYNLNGGTKSGKVLVGNWQEERQWGDEIASLKRDCHGTDMITNSGASFANTEYRETFNAPNTFKKSIPPREARAMNSIYQDVSREITTEALAAEDHSMYFTRERYLDQPKVEYDGPITYLEDEPITIYSQKKPQERSVNGNTTMFRKNSRFTRPDKTYFRNAV